MIRFTSVLVMGMLLPLAGFGKTETKGGAKVEAKAGNSEKTRKVAGQSNVPCSNEAYAAAFKDVVDDRRERGADFANYAIIGSGTTLAQKSGEKVTVTVMLSTWVGGVETGAGQPRQFNVDLRTTHDNACQFIKITEFNKEGEGS